MLGIGIGSRTSTGGVVIEGNDGIVFDGLIASSVGQKATCPACKKGIGEIVAIGSRTVYLPAGLAARAGDYIACGCPPGSNVLIAQGTVDIGSESNIPLGRHSSPAGLDGYSGNADSHIEVGFQDKARSDSLASPPAGRVSIGANSDGCSSGGGLAMQNDEAVVGDSANAANPEKFLWHLEANQYAIRQVAYLPAEGVGVNGSFFLKGSLVLNDRGLFVSAMGFTAAVRLGKVQFQATVKVELNGTELFYEPLTIGKEAGIWPDGDYLPIGSININVPSPQADDQMQVTISGTYIYSVPEGRAVPIPSTGAVTIPIKSLATR